MNGFYFTYMRCTDRTSVNNFFYYSRHFLSAAAMSSTKDINDYANEKGAYVRQESKMRNYISKNGPYPPEANRYHLYISYACPWAHRTLIVRNLKGLQSTIGLSVVHWFLGKDGWTFSEMDNCIPDTVNNFKFVKDLYYQTDPNYSDRFTVPILYDKKTRTIVNNESSEIVRILGHSFNEFASVPELDLYPEALRPRIDELNEMIYDGINNGVYKAGFATSQAVYEENARLVYEALLNVDAILARNKFLCGDVLTEADIRLFPSAIRFDAVYYSHFKCNLIAVRELANLSRWLKDIYEIPLIKDTVNMNHIKNCYYKSQSQLNPTGIVPLYNGPFGN